MFRKIVAVVLLAGAVAVIATAVPGLVENVAVACDRSGKDC